MRWRLIILLIAIPIVVVPMYFYLTRPILSVENTSSKEGWNVTYGFYVTVTGEIFNDGIRPAHNVRVVVIGYDSEGNVVESGYDTIQEIPAKGSRAFSVLLYIEMAKTIDSYKVNLEYKIW